MMSVEEMCRQLLAQAIADDLVDLNHVVWPDPSPRIRTAGELIGVANRLEGFSEYSGLGA